MFLLFYVVFVCDELFVLLGGLFFFCLIHGSLDVFNFFDLHPLSYIRGFF